VEFVAKKQGALVEYPLGTSDALQPYSTEPANRDIEALHHRPFLSGAKTILLL
jgi:hypothetical protein